LIVALIDDEPFGYFVQKHCKLSKNKQLELIKYFIAGAAERTVVDLVGIHRNTAIRFFHKLRKEIALK
jgi:transposase